MTNPSITGLQFATPQSAAGTPKVGRNLNLNDAYQPPWDQTDAMQSGASQNSLAGPMGDTRFDPFQGTQWGRFLDTVNEQAPGGIKTPSGKGDPLTGLQEAGAAFAPAHTPTSKTPTTQTSAVDNPFAARQRLQGY